MYQQVNRDRQQKSNNLSLNPLKYQIDKRILKINYMLSKLNIQSPTKNIKKQNKGVQISLDNYNNQYQCNQVLSSLKINNNLSNQSPLKHHFVSPKMQKKSSRRSEKQNSCNKPLPPIMEKSLSPLHGYTFRQKSNDKQICSPNKTSRSKIFTVTNNLYIPPIQSIFFNRYSQNQYKFKSAIASKQYPTTNMMTSTFSQFSQGYRSSRKQKRFRTSGQNQPLTANRRIIVGVDCKKKMEEYVNMAINRRRKQPQDNNIRNNMIRKIQEKFGSMANS